MNFLAQAPELNFWNGEPGSTALITKIIIGFVIGFGALIGCLYAPPTSRKKIIGAVTFLGGAYWVLYYLWPSPAFRGPNDVPEGFVDRVGFWLSDATSTAAGLANIISGFILALGVYSLARIHLKRVASRHKDQFFSLLLLVSMAVMLVVSVLDYVAKKNDKDNLLVEMSNWGPLQYARDMMFDGLYMVMDAAMFSMISFFILSAAYRAFRLRSVEATILLTAALITILSLMGAISAPSSDLVEGWAKNAGSFEPVVNSLSPDSVKNWIADVVQAPGIRAIEFGLGLGALGMGLRVWLNLERGVGGS